MRASPGLAWCAAGRAANSRWSTLTKDPSLNPRAETHSSSHDRLGWFVGDKRVQHLRMTSRISPTSGLAADVAIVDALRVVWPLKGGGSPQPPWREVVVARRARSGTGSGSRVRGHSKASVAARHRGIVVVC